MSVIPKSRRVYPYNNGLLLGGEVDIILSNINSEPVDAAKLFEVDKIYSIDKTGGGEAIIANQVGNHFKVVNGMIRLIPKLSYCRGYATDNFWWSMKNAVTMLKKRAFLSFLPFLMDEDFIKPENNGMTYIAGGHVSCHVITQSLYDTSICGKLHKMTYDKTHESHERLKNNIRLLIGIPSTLFDRRESAEYRRRNFAPNDQNEFRYDNNDRFVYQTPTNYWIFTPALCHFILGALRMTYFITYNQIEEEIWEGFEPGDVNCAIAKSDYDVAQSIWDMVKGRLGESGYQQAENPFWSHRAIALDFLFDNGLHMLTGGVYSNWQMKRRKNNYQGHFNQLPSWDAGITGKILTTNNPNYPLWEKFKENYERREKERTAC